ncbi:ISL3 family transposase [Acuticoccus sediminis]|uniref:ISL3 family transposase n=1 Tax=Acuticoccus sediminis TaxID=2184697 RepID=A0A8B2NJC6_9HYPH|nr:ISL3 family transposase [Acuticoccus sediminis]RAH95920.1 ISL3 family transposase [Acuticoccus sediminis]
MSVSKRERQFTLAGLLVERVTLDGDGVLVSARSTSASASCPCCGRGARRVHSRYQRRLADLPAHGCRVEMVVTIRRFCCVNAACKRRIFAERLDPGAAAARSRRTERLDGIVHHLGFALGGRPAQAVARRLLLPVSKDTLLRTVRRRAPAAPAPLAIGIDDWAWRKGHRYGTLICDLERRSIIDLLPDREPATVAAWLAERPSIEIIARDRGGGYGAGAAKGRPEAVQVADRWHLFENASAAFLLVVKRCMREVRRALAQGPVDPATLTAAERLQHEGWQRRADADAVVLMPHEQGVAIKEIARRTGRSRKLVRDVVRGGRAEPFRPRASSLEPWLDRLNAEWNGGCRNGAELWRRLRAVGFPGALRVVTEWVTRRRRDEAGSVPLRCPGSRTLARLLTLARDKLTRAEAIIVATVTREAPEIIAARETVDAFHRLIRSRDANGLEPWIRAAFVSPIASFARGIAADRAAVAAAIALVWSNGQTEGNICKLKTLKRQMGGRANLDLLRARLMPAA